MDNSKNKVLNESSNGKCNNIVRIQTGAFKGIFRCRYQNYIGDSNNDNNDDKNYQNPSKFLKTDENGAGVPCNMPNMAHNYALGMQACNTQNFDPHGSIDAVNSLDPRLNNSGIAGQDKHGAQNNRQNDVNSTNHSSYANRGGHNAQHHEHKHDNESDEAYSDDPKSRTSASSRVNFSKLTAEEKERRCHNMSKEVKQLRRKIRNMEERLARSNITMDYAGSGASPENAQDNVVHRAREKLKSYNGYELSDQKDLIDNLSNAIAEDRLKLDSFQFYMICTLVRATLSQEEVNKYSEENDKQNEQNKDTGLENKEIVISLPEKEVRISRKEFQYYSAFHDNEQVMRLLTGQIKEPPGSSSTQNTMQNGNDQLEMLNKSLQGNMSSINPSMMQNLLNTQMQSILSSQMQSNLSPSITPQSAPNVPLQMQSQYSPQMLNNLLSNTMQNPSNWNLNSQMNQMPQANYANLSQLNQLNNQSLNDIIQSQL